MYKDRGICSITKSLNPSDSSFKQASVFERADLFALLYVMFYCVLSLSHVVSWVSCGAWLYRFLIFAFFLTFILITVPSDLEAFEAYKSRLSQSDVSVYSMCNQDNVSILYM